MEKSAQYRIEYLNSLKVGDEVVIKRNLTRNSNTEKILKITPTRKIITTSHNMLNEEISEKKFNEKGILYYCGDKYDYDEILDPIDTEEQNQYLRKKEVSRKLREISNKDLNLNQLNQLEKLIQAYEEFEQ